jgi:aminoglycoside 2'-N-acetyltransferase I
MPATHLFRTNEAETALLAEVRALLLDAFHGDFSEDDWGHALGGWHVIVSEGGVVLAHAAVVPRTLGAAGRPVHTGYVEAVATAPGRRRQGLGSLAMSELATVLRREFEMGALSTDSYDFYARLGWERWQGPTFARHGDRVIRTADEDDGIMVLRFGAHRDVDLGSPLTCEGRPGDDW